LTPLSPTRKAFRLVGGVLVERTVASVLPSVQENRSNIQSVLENLQKMLDAKTGEMKEWKVKHNIKTQEEAQAEERRMQQQRGLEGPSEVA
jgi:prefoldin subunit 2